MHQDITLVCQDEVPLAATLFVPESPKAAVMIGPATGIKRQFYFNFARYLCEQGYGVITFDNRGIGESLQGDIKSSSASLVLWGQQDMPSVLSALQQRFPSVPHFLIGHSAGGQLTGLMHNATDLSAMFNFGSSSGSLRNMALPYRIKAHFFMNVFIPVNNMLFGHTKSHLVGMGEPLPRSVARQWQRWCNGQGYVKTAFGKEVTQHWYEAIDFPSHWLLASDDDIACERNARDMISVYPNMPAELEVVKPEEANISDIGHMKFFSRQCQSLWPKATGFFEKHLPPAILAG